MSNVPSFACLAGPLNACSQIEDKLIVQQEGKSSFTATNNSHSDTIDRVLLYSDFYAQK